MERPEFDRKPFGDTAPPIGIDYDYCRHRAALERRAAIAAFPGKVRPAFRHAWLALSRLRLKFMRMRDNAARHKNLWPENAGNDRRRA
jgi:hypothetical protein